MVGRRNNATAEKRAAFLVEYAKTGTVHRAANAIGVSRVTVWRWCEADEQFKAAMDAARDTSTDVLEDTLYERAVKHDTTAAIFLLKGRRREVYGDRVTQDHTGSVTVDLVWPDGHAVS